MSSTLLFVIVSALTHNPMLATALAIAAGVGRIGYVRARRQKISAMQWMSLGLVVVFGAATLLTPGRAVHDGQADHRLHPDRGGDDAARLDAALHAAGRPRPWR
jgi:hypothetical protein